MFQKYFFPVLILIPSALASPQTYHLDTTASLLKWTGEKVTSAHHGTVKIQDGSVSFDGQKLIDGSFKINMSSIDNVDIKDPKYKKKLVDHLISNDFFSATDYPLASFTITSATPILGAQEAEPNYTITGILSIKGIENEISFPAKISIANNEASASGIAKLDRTKWNIKYGSGKFFESLGDKLILDDFTVELDLKARA